MKTFKRLFDIKDLITWSNRDEAECGKQYYFGNSIRELEYNTENKIVRELTSIDDRQFDPFISHTTYYSCILPIDKVIDTVKD